MYEPVRPAEWQCETDPWVPAPEYESIDQRLMMMMVEVLLLCCCCVDLFARCIHRGADLVANWGQSVSFHSVVCSLAA